MKKSLILATVFVVGASAAGAGAANNFATTPYVGSDTEYNITNQAILNSGLGNKTVGPSLTTWNSSSNPLGDYSGGGSGGAENAMAAATPVQQTGPMSRALGGGPGKGACASSNNLAAASGIVLGIDAVRIFASNAVISANQTSCNGATTTAACTQDPSGLVYSGSVGNGTVTMTFANWRDVLALLYGGLDRSVSPNVVDCTSAKRALLVSAWTNLFQNTTSCPNSTNGTALTHAWRRDDNSGTSDVFSNLAGFQAAEHDQFGNATAKFAVSASAVNGFGTSPYCNAMNWDTTEAAKIPSTAATTCNLAADLHYVGPGGVPVASSADPLCVSGGSAGSTGSVTCHHVPPANTYGVQPLGTQSVVLPTSYQDNDPIRTACLGAGVSGHASDDVCNTDGKLGIVLPIPALDFIHIQNPGLVSFTGAVDCGSGSIAGDPPKVFVCAPRNKGTTGNGLCPNNDAPLGIGCLIPIGTGSGGATSQCQATKSEGVSCFTGPCGSDARVYNVQAYDGTGTDSVHNAHYLNVSYSVNDGGSVGSFTQSINMAGAYGRVHQREKATGGKYVCNLDDASDQIGCLSQADPNSMGYAGNTGDTWENRDPNATAGCTSCSLSTAPNTQGLRVSKLEAGTTCLPAAPGSGIASYPLWRKLYFNSEIGFSHVTNTAELNLGQYESEDDQMNSILTQFAFFPLPFSPNGTGPGGAPAQFCEDFNETLAANCNTAGPGGSGFTGNANGCNTNVGLTTSGFGTIPSDPSANPADATTSTVCGNGLLEDFEDCDFAITLTTTSIPTLAACGSCSATCRCSLF